MALDVYKRQEEDGTIVTTDEEGNETEFTPYLAPALCMDEFENLIYAENGYNVVSMLGPVFQPDTDGNIVETTADGMQTVVGKAPVSYTHLYWGTNPCEMAGW